MSRQISGTLLKSYVDTDALLILEATIDSGTIPTTASLFSQGAKVIDLSTGISYFNTGTTAVPVWNRQGSSDVTDPLQMKLAINTLTAADMIATGAGQLSHANGLTMVAAAPTGYVNVWHRTIVSYTFATAAFTGGGNTTVNIGGGGAALSGLIATTTLWQNASSIIQEFVPLSTVAFPITKETAISLKTASAITNPGTAAGSCKIYTWYSQVPI